MIGITGGNGVLGRILKAKYDSKNIKITLFFGDVTNFNDVNKWIAENNISILIHLASKVAVKDVQNNLADAYDVNVGGTINILKAIATKSSKIYFFYASTSHVYKSSDNPLCESSKVEPINSYGLTKHISEQLLNDFCSNNANFNLCIGRIFSFYHDSQLPPFLYPTLLKRFKTEDLMQPFRLYGALSSRDFLNAEAVCDIIILLIEKTHTGTVNIASGTAIKIIDFVQKIAPQKLNIIFDNDEKPNHLNADVSLLDKILQHD